MDLRKWKNMFRSRKNGKPVFPRYLIQNSGPNRAARRRNAHMIKRMAGKKMTGEQIQLAMSQDGSSRIELPRLMNKMLDNWANNYSPA